MQSEQKENRFTRNQYEWDTINATYRHLIYTNKGKKFVIPGYSKGKNTPEPKDKEQCLQGVIKRLLNRGYLTGSDKIEFFQRHFLDSKLDEKILILYNPESVRDHYVEYTSAYEWIVPFIDKVYDLIREQKRIQDDIIIDRGKKFKKHKLDIEDYKVVCNTRAEFIHKMAALKTEGKIPYSLLVDFFNTYKLYFHD